jgi:hypothetical protein
MNKPIEHLKEFRTTYIPNVSAECYPDTKLFSRQRGIG